MTARTLSASLALTALTALGRASPAMAQASADPVGTSTAAAQAPLAPPPAGASRPAEGAMVQLPGGSFKAGEGTGVAGDVATYYRVSSFQLDATEVTVAAYGACVRAKGCTPAGTDVRKDGLRGKERDKWSAFCNGDRADRADHPVNCVDWSQAQKYCAWAGKRLPAEEEWEWAARNAGAGSTYAWGDDPPADRACWSGPGNGTGGQRAGTCPVGTHPRGDAPSGAQDLVGNVWEWTATADVILADSRGRGGVPAKIARGGGWADTDARTVGAARRAKNLPTDRLSDLGFRCARSP